MATFISEEEADRRLTSPDNLCVQMVPESGDLNILKLHNGGKNEGDKNIPLEIQAVIGAAAHLDTAKNVADEFGVSPQQVHNLKHGRTTYLKGKNEKLVDALGIEKKKVADLALQRTLEAMGVIKPSDLEGKPVQAADVALKMANVFEKMSPKEASTDGSNVQVNVFVPRVKNEEEYDVIEVHTEQAD